MAALARAHRAARAGAFARPHARAFACTFAGALVAVAAGAAPASAPQSAPVFQPPGCHGGEDASVSRLAARVRRERLYADWARPDCLDYIVDRCSARTVEVSLHERHDARCGGDPATAPRVDSFRVWRRSSRIDWYALDDDAWRPFERIHSEAHR
jgi:hypothetical protein